MNNSGHLCITGSVYSKKTAPAGNEFGIINNSGDLSIRGDLKFSFPNHRINMTDEGAVLKIGGDASLYSAYCNITAGKVIFNGTEQQTISGLRAGHIILENESEFGVVLSTSISPNLLFDHRGNNFTLKSGGTFVDYDGDGLKDNVDPYPTVGNSCVISVQSCDIEKGTVSTDVIETIGGTSHTVTAEPTFKYAFSKWTDETGKVLSTDSEYIVVAKKDTTLTAVFEKRTQPVTIQIAEGGTINVPIFAPIEETLEIPIIENDGYVFREGSLMYNGIPVVHGQFIMPDEPVIITAEFERNDNYFALLDGITEAKAVSGDGYSAKSFASLQEVIAAAEESLANAVSAEVSRYYVGRLQQCIEELQTRYIVGLSVKAAGVLYWNAPEQIEKITIEVAYDNGTSKDIKGLDCSISGYDSTNYEPQIITVTYNGFSANLSVTVRKVPIASVFNEAIPTQLFYGAAVTPVPKLTSRYNEGVELVCGKDYTFSYTNNGAIGTGRFMITGIGNYQGTRSISFTIECGHIYSDWIVDSSATFYSVGYRRHICDLCGYTQTEEIPVLEVTGSSGTSATWNLSGGALTISGSGAMRSFANKTSMPWYDYLDQIEEIIIEEGVTSIGNYAFAGCANVTSVTIDSDVASIGVNAFSGCSKLETISLPASLTSISNYAFNNCSALSLIEFNSAAAPSLGANALANTKATAIYKSSWSGFAKDKFGGKTTWLIDHVNGSCGATKYSLDCGVMTISGKGTIRGYSKGEAPWYSLRDEIQNVIIGDGVTSIGNYAFYGCENLSGLTLGSSVATIGTSAFYGCAALDEVTFPASLTELKAYAFSNCSGLSELTFESEAAPVIASTALNAVRAKAVHADSGNWSEFGGSGFGGAIYWTDDPEEEVLGGSCGGQAAWTFVDGTLTIYGENGTRGYSKKTDVPWYEYRDQITKIVVEDGITSLGNYSFMECENVTEVYLSNTLTFIGVNVFSTCKKLTSITIPETVNTINGYAFNKCSALERVVFEGDTAPTISKNAFNTDAANLYYRTSSSWKAFDKIGFSGKNVWREYAGSSITLPPDSI